jgi:hypothetical protein
MKPLPKTVKVRASGVNARAQRRKIPTEIRYFGRTD